MSDEIPFEIQLEIIKRVIDLNSLIRFRSVSKPWKSFIDSSEFIAGYGFRETRPRRLVIRYTEVVDSYSEKYLYVVDDDDNDTFTHQHDFVPTVYALIKQLNYSSMVVGNSRGLFCLYGINNSGRNMVVIWNPSIRKSIGVVVPYLFNAQFKTTVFGFGVCPMTCDPTIVKISYIDMYLQMTNIDNIPWHVEVFTLSWGVWNVIPSSNLPRESVRLDSSTQVVIDRFIYWSAYDSIVDMDGVSQKSYMIVSFDLTTKEFSVIDLPNSFTNQFCISLSICKLRESLVVFGYATEVGEAVCGVWMMEHNGVIPSFTKLYNINIPHESVNKILGFRKNDEPILETRKHYKQFATLEVHKPCSQHVNTLGIYGQDSSFFMGSYKETLLLVDHPDCYIYSDIN